LRWLRSPPGSYPFVSNTQDSGAGSLRGTVAAAAAGDTIVFNIPTSDPGYNVSTGVFTIYLTSGEIVIDKDLTITGPFSGEYYRQRQSSEPDLQCHDRDGGHFQSLDGRFGDSGKGNS
jgi:hypothetical protein